MNLYTASNIVLNVNAAIRSLPSVVLALSAVMAAAAPAIADDCPLQYEATAIIEGPDCGIFPNAVVTARGMNNLGWVCGSYFQCFPDDNDEAFYWTPETGVVTIPRPEPYYNSVAIDISDSGYVVGTMIATNPGKYRAFRYHIPTGELVFIEPPRSSWLGSEAAAVNEAGWIAGNVWENGDNLWRAFRWDGRSMVLAVPTFGIRSVSNCMSELGTVGGWMGQSTLIDAHPATFNGTTVFDFGLVSGAIGGSVADVENSGTALLVYQLLQRGQKNSHPFLWFEDTLTNLGLADGCKRCALGEMNEAMVAVGACTMCTPSPSKRGVLWKEGQYYFLSDVLVGTDAIVTDAISINEKGQILVNWNLPGWAVLSPVKCTKFADLNADGAVDGTDLGILLGEWNATESIADLNGDAGVDGADLGMLLTAWDG
jgi:uncharacterized membrane protein